MDSDLAQVLVSIDATHLETSQNEEDEEIEELEEFKPSIESLNDDSSFDSAAEQKLDSYTNENCEELIEQCKRKSLPSVTVSCNERKRPNKYTYLPPHPYKCTLCDFTTSDLEVISEHGDVLHQEDTILSCNTCSSFKSSLVKVVKHHASEHNTLEFQKHLNFRSSISEADIAAMYIKDKKFSCTICNFEDASFVKFKAHMKSEHDTSLYICSQCDFKASDMSSLRSHISNYHVEITPFECPLCEYSSQNTGNILFHAEKHKEMEMPRGCNLCGFKTQFTKRLRCHALLHLDNIRFDCYLCYEPFDRMVDIVKHFKDKHSITIYKANKCVQCPLTFQLRKELIEHEFEMHSTMKPYKCSQCFYAFNTVKRFAEHCKTFHNEQDFEKLVIFDSHVNQVYIDTLKRYDTYIRNSEDVNFKKQFCTFSRPSSLTAKVSTVLTKNVNKKYDCKICPFEASKVATLVSHMEKVHSKFNSKTNSNQNDPEYVTRVGNDTELSLTVRTSKRKKSLPAKYQMQHECDVCNFQAATFELLSKHKLVFHKRKIKKFIISKEDEGLTEPPSKKGKLTNNFTKTIPLDSHTDNISSSLNSEEKIENSLKKKKKSIGNSPVQFGKVSNSYLEAVHNSKFKTNNTCKEEINIKPSEQFLDCHLCDFKSDRVDILSSHMFINHLEVVGKKTCYHCKMQFDDVERLRFHIAITHDDNDSLVCGFCGLSIPTTHLYEAHVAYKHNRLTDIECAHCLSKFRSLKFMKYHMKKHRDEIEKIAGMLFPCAYCPFGAEKFQQYNKHVENEHPDCEPMKCKFCPYVGTAKSQFRKHLFVKHHQLKEFNCPYCDYCASHKDEMKMHVKRIHSVMFQ